MPMDNGRNHMEPADEDCPVCSIEPALVRGNESSPEQLCVKGMEEYDNGQLLRAMQYYMTALSLNPDFIPALLGTTCVLVAMERYQEAQSYLDYVFELDPDIKDAKLLRNIINNAKSGYPVFESSQDSEDTEVKLDDSNDNDNNSNNDSEEDIEEIPPEKSTFQKAQPYLLGVLFLILCYMAALPYVKEPKTGAVKPDITVIRQNLAAEPALKNTAIKAEMKGSEIVLSGRVDNQAERRLAIVIAEQGGGKVKVEAGKLQVGENTAEVKPEVKPTARPVAKPADNSQKTSTPKDNKHYYTVQRGDTLSLIARKKYGDGIYWKKIQAANPKLLRNQDDLQPGMVIILPD